MTVTPVDTVPLMPDQRYQALPKVDLHRHLEGSLRLATMTEIARLHGLENGRPDQLQSLVQVMDHDPLTFQNFLSKFEILRHLYRTPEIIGRITHEAIADAAADNVRYLELRFTPVALSAAQGFMLSEVMDWVCEHAHLASLEYGISTHLIASVNRHESVKIAEQVVQLALDRKNRGIVGLDLAGNEAAYSARPFVGLFREAQQGGLHITLHAGEWGGAENVAQALVDFNAERIGHGVRVMEDTAVVELARQRGAVFEVCLTSNYQTGVIPSLASHPVTHMLEAGLSVTLATDDPSISRITLSDEYRSACEQLHISFGDLRQIILGSAQAAFISARHKENLAASMMLELDETSQDHFEG
jgi:adenosine deaminase